MLRLTKNHINLGLWVVLCNYKKRKAVIVNLWRVRFLIGV